MTADNFSYQQGFNKQAANKQKDSLWLLLIIRCFPGDRNQIPLKCLFWEAQRNIASKHRVNLVQELHDGSEAGRFSKAPSCPVPTGRQLCSSSRFQTFRRLYDTSLICQNNNQLQINWQLYQKAAEETKRRPRQLSKQKITQDLKYGISAKGSSDPGLAQDVNSVQIHRNLKSHYPLGFPREKGLELPDDIILRWQNRNISPLLMLGLAPSINNSTSRSKLLLNQCRWARPKPKAKSHKLFHTSTAVHRCKFCTDFLVFLKLNISPAQRP